MIVDAHCHLTPELPAADLIRIMDRDGIDKTVLLAQATEPARPSCLRWGSRSFCGLGQLPSPVPDNEPVAAALAAYPKRFIAFVSVTPDDPAHLETIDRYLALGFRGVKTDAGTARGNLGRKLLPLARRAGDAGFPVLVHLEGGRRTSGALLDLADRLPTTTFIIAHGAVPFHRALWRAARVRPNLYFDMAGPLVTAEIAGLAAAEVAPGRLLFGSGGPVGLRCAEGGYSYAAAKRLVAGALPPRVSEGARRAVFGGNILRLVGLAQPTGCRSAASGSPGGRYSNRPGR